MKSSFLHEAVSLVPGKFCAPDPAAYSLPAKTMPCLMKNAYMKSGSGSLSVLAYCFLMENLVLAPRAWRSWPVNQVLSALEWVLAAWESCSLLATPVLMGPQLEYCDRMRRTAAWWGFVPGWAWPASSLKLHFGSPACRSESWGSWHPPPWPGETLLAPWTLCRRCCAGYRPSQTSHPVQMHHPLQTRHQSHPSSCPLCAAPVPLLLGASAPLRSPAPTLRTGASFWHCCSGPGSHQRVTGQCPQTPPA